MRDKTAEPLPCPPVLALFQKRIEGDDALLELASARFRESGLGAEFYAQTPEELDRILRFRPSPRLPAVVHLDRSLDLFDEGSRELIRHFARNYGGQVFGLVVHDQAEIAHRFDDYLATLQEMERSLRGIPRSPCLFIEYAVGLEAGLFIDLFESIREAAKVSSCIDIGHLGIRQARRIFSRSHPGRDICSLTPQDPYLPYLIEDVQRAVRSAADEVLPVVQRLCRLGKPVHFHLHDAHPLSVISPFGISDHLSFLQEIAIPFEYEGSRTLPLMFGPSGLSRIVKATLEPGAPVSLSLEIHPTEGRTPLGEAASLFRHWRDKTNAEEMNHWLSVIIRNHQLIMTLLNAHSCDDTCTKKETARETT